MFGRYLQVTSENITTKNEEEKNSNMTKNNEQKYRFLYNYLSKNYIEKNNITLENISNFIEISNTPIKFTAIKIHAVEEEKTRVYSVYGRIENKATGNFVKYAFFKVKFDINTDVKYNVAQSLSHRYFNKTAAFYLAGYGEYFCTL